MRFKSTKQRKAVMARLNRNIPPVQKAVWKNDNLNKNLTIEKGDREGIIIKTKEPMGRLNIVAYVKDSSDISMGKLVADRTLFLPSKQKEYQVTKSIQRSIERKI